MAKISKADIALNAIQARRRAEYLTAVNEPLSKPLVDELEALAELAQQGIDPDMVREEAERALLRWIRDPVFSEAFYNVRRFCS